MRWEEATVIYFEVLCRMSWVVMQRGEVGCS